MTTVRTIDLDFTAWKYHAATVQTSRCEGSACYAREFGPEDQPCGVMALATGVGPEGIGAKAANAFITALAAELRQEGRFEAFRQSWWEALFPFLVRKNAALRELGRALDAPVLVSACFAMTEPQEDGYKLTLLSIGNTLCYYGAGTRIQRCNHLDTDGEKPNPTFGESAILNRCLGLSDAVQPHYYTIDNISKSSPVFLASSGFSLYRPDLFVALNDAADPAVAVHNATELIKEKRGLGCGDAVLLGLRKGVIADG